MIVVKAAYRLLICFFFACCCRNGETSYHRSKKQKSDLFRSNCHIDEPPFQVDTPSTFLPEASHKCKTRFFPKQWPHWGAEKKLQTSGEKATTGTKSWSVQTISALRHQQSRRPAGLRLRLPGRLPIVQNTEEFQRLTVALLMWKHSLSAKPQSQRSSNTVIKLCQILKKKS